MKCGLIGEKLGHSLSPQIHEEIYRALGITGTYELLEMERQDIPAQLKKLSAAYTGMNVTIPYKIEVMPFLTKISEAATRIGAVNTIHVRPDGLFGYNTDYLGFGRSLQQAGIEVKGNKCVVLGTGGAARAILQYLSDQGAAVITVVSRQPQMLEEAMCHFLQQLGAEVINYDALAGYHDYSLIVNCTPVGMFPHVTVCPVTEQTVAQFPAVVDLIYNPKDTIFLQYGQAHGAKTLNGLYMLVAQAVAAEEIWLGKPIEAGIVAAIVRKMETLI